MASTEITHNVFSAIDC